MRVGQPNYSKAIKFITCEVKKGEQSRVTSIRRQTSGIPNIPIMVVRKNQGVHENVFLYGLTHAVRTLQFARH